MLSICSFPDYFLAPQFGYANVLDYYTDALVSNRVSQFSIPVFGLSATDDPLQPGESEFIGTCYGTLMLHVLSY